ncbi:MAG: serine/threonine-protein kinase [Gemmatimonadota bacterium]
MSEPTDPPKKASQPTVQWDPEELKEAAQAREAGDPQADAPQDPLVGQLLRGKWKVLKRLGAGSYGTVYKVKDEKGGWIEALKILGVDRITGAEAENVRARFLREAQIMKRLGAESPHIVGLSTYEEDIEAGLIYFLMEFVDGKSLGDVLQEEGPFSVEKTLRIALQVCDALAVAHDGPEGVVHRDLKLENIMLTHDRAGNEIAKVLDFGIAKVAEKEADTRLTAAGALGTPGYAAPEQLRAEEVDARTDLFAFGVILYALLTGRDPWLGNPAGQATHQVYDLMVATERGVVRPMGEVEDTIPPALVHAIRKLLKRDPDERFASATELKQALLAIAEGDSSLDPGKTSGKKDRASQDERDSGRRGIRIPVLAAGGLGVVVLAGLLVLQPWGRELGLSEVLDRAGQGSVSTVTLAAPGLRGSLAVGPLQAPFRVPLAPDQLPETVASLDAVGVEVDTSAEVARLVGLAAEAQRDMRYYHDSGEDVREYALRAEILDPTRPEPRSLLLKVAERMAWDAQAMAADGEANASAALVEECLTLVAEHPGCLALVQ